MVCPQKISRTRPMNDVTKSNAPVSYAEKAWQSDVIVDLIKHYGFPYIALNPGASYRGLHDSLVNYGGNQPPILLCQHEKIAVQIAHGYAKATGKPMVAIVHDVVGMLHATMGIYYAYIDRCPVFVIGATGPMDESRRRPFIDWIHTANVNGEQLRHYVKWDYQPSSIEGVPDSFSRAYAAMMTEPQGPVYMCYDAWLQEQPLSAEIALPAHPEATAPGPMAADPAALSKWSMDFTRMPNCSLRVLGDTLTAIPELTKLCQKRTAWSSSVADRIAKRTAEVAARHDAQFAKWADEAREDWDASPIALPRLAHELWEVIKTEDWVLTACTLQDWALKLWDFDRPYRHAGRALGTGTQIGVSLGVALAHRGTGRLVVDIQPDGDLMFDAGALWTAAKNNIAFLVVMYNNRAYYNDWEHQIKVAEHRGTPVERAHIGQAILGPAPDFAKLAQSCGWYAEGPIEQPKDIAGALRRAIEKVKAGKPALVDTVLQAR